jgi:hypothetical protein
MEHTPTAWGFTRLSRARTVAQRWADGPSRRRRAASRVRLDEGAAPSLAWAASSERSLDDASDASDVYDECADAANTPHNPRQTERERERESERARERERERGVQRCKRCES